MVERPGDVVLLWLRRDLRLRRNAALLEAAARAAGPAGRLLPVFVWEPPERRVWAPGAAARWWLARSLAALDAGLTGLGSGLAVYEGDPLVLLPRLAAQTQARAVVWAAGLEPEERVDDGRLPGVLPAHTQPVLVPSGNLLLDPAGPLTREGRPYTVFTPYWRRALGLLETDAVTAGGRPAATGDPGVAALPPAPALPAQPGRTAVTALVAATGHPWAAGFSGIWSPGEAGAGRAVEALVAGPLASYATERDGVAEPGTSRLSPHLHWGEITAAQVWESVTQRLAEEGLRLEAGIAPAGRDTTPSRLGRSAGAFVRQLGWREFGHHLLHHFPHTAEHPLREKYARFPWREDTAALHAWQRGLTGYPLVDAGMRELWASGWMHNRARLVTASFLVKHLLLPWRLGEAWFWDTLLDADVAANALGWQWVAGSGADAAPYFRIFDPLAQARRYDPEGEYVRRWVPELAGADCADGADARQLRLDDGRTTAQGVSDAGYPGPIVDHREARLRALAAYDVMRAADARTRPGVKPTTDG